MINEKFLESFLPKGKSIDDFAIPANPALDFKEYPVKYIGPKIKDRDFIVNPGDTVSLTYLPGGQWALCLGMTYVALDAVKGVNFEYIPGEEHPPANCRP